jgi:O-antigen/teichoic acid export membrane protein
VFSHVFLPAAASFAVLVWLAAARWGLAGAAVAHAAVSLVAAAAMIGVVTLGSDEPAIVETATAEAESAFQD